LTSTAETTIKRFDLMMGVNARGTFLCTKICLPHLRRAANPHVLVLSPPLRLEPKWFAPNVAYAMAKYGMSLCVLGMAEEFRPWGISVNALWPRTIIATAALQVIPGAPVERARKPEIVADAAWQILQRDSREATGRFYLDEEVLREAGTTDFSGYAVNPALEPREDIFV
jgi:citronellol/citronellal dehydrogenase